MSAAGSAAGARVVAFPEACDCAVPDGAEFGAGVAPPSGCAGCWGSGTSIGAGCDFRCGSGCCAVGVPPRCPHAATVCSMRAERAESPGNVIDVGIASSRTSSCSPAATAALGDVSPMSLRAALLMHTTELSCMFHDHSAWIGCPADVNDAMMRHGSRPRRVAFQLTPSRLTRAAANVRSMTSPSERILDSFGAGTRRNCSIA